MNSTGIYLNGFTPNLTGRIWPVEFDQALISGQIGCKLCKFTEIVLPLTGNVISMDLHPIWPVKFNWSNGRIWLVKFQIWLGMKYCSNWVEIHCMPPWSNWVSSQWIQLASISMDLLPIRPVEFDQALISGQIGCKLCKFTEIVLPLTGNVISMDLHPIWPVKFDWSNGRIWPVKFQIWLGMKYCSNWVEIHCMPPWSNWVSSQWIQLASISMDLLPFRPVEFDQALISGQIGCKLCKFTEIVLPLTGNVISMDLHPIWLVKFDWAWNTAQIGWKFIVCLPGRIGYHPNEFT